MEEKTVEIFEKLPVHKAVLKNAIPAMAAMLMVLIYNLADTFFIGQTHDAIQVAAVSLATPVFLFFTSLGTIFGIGGTSVISRALGEGRKDYAKKVCSFCMWGCVIVGIAVALLFLAFIEPILSLIGATADTRELAKLYLIIVVCSSPFILISNCYSNVVRAEGKPGIAMMGQIIGNMMNVVLDPIMILGFGWDIAGAAIATVIGNVVGAAFYILYYVRGGSILSISLKNFSIKNGVCYGVLIIGIPAALNSILLSISQILVNGQLSEYGDMAIAGMGVAIKILLITIMICTGLGQGIQPLLGYCFGAKLWKRFGSVLKLSVIFAFIIGTALTLFCYLFVNPIVSAFLTEKSAFDYAVQFSKVMLISGPLLGIFFVLMNALQAMGAATASFIVNISKQGIIFIPTLIILRKIAGLTGIVWTQPVADIISFLIAVILYIAVYKKFVRVQKNS